MLQGQASKYEPLKPDSDSPRGAATSVREDEKKGKCCNDPIFAALFIAGLTWMTTKLVTNREGLAHAWKTSTLKTDVDQFDALYACQTLGASFGVAIIFSSLWSAFMRFCVKSSIYLLFIISIVAQAAGAGAIFYLASTMEHGWPRSWLIAGGILVVLLLGYTMYLVYTLCDRVALATCLLEVSGGVLNETPVGMSVLTSMNAIVQLLWATFCGAAAWAISMGSDNLTEGQLFGTQMLICLMAYWGLQIISNIGVVGCYGTLAGWYYESRVPLVAPICKASTSYFGSIACGSLLVAMVQTVHDGLHLIQKKGWFPAWLLCCLDKVLEWIEAGFKYLNSYGFVMVAVHGDSFFTASRRAMDFLKYKGLTALINDSIVDRVQRLGAVAGGILAGAVPVLIQRWRLHQDMSNMHLNGNQETTLATAGFVLGSFTVFTLISPIHSYVTALLVCFAEHPEELASRHPDDYAKLMSTWTDVYGADFVDKAATIANLTASGDIVAAPLTGDHQKASVAVDLERLATLRESGQLTAEEFDVAKAQLLGTGNAQL